MLNVTARQELMSKILDTLMIVVEDARFDFEEDGLTVRVVDSSHVAMIKLTVDAAAFDGWELDNVSQTQYYWPSMILLIPQYSVFQISINEKHGHYFSTYGLILVHFSNVSYNTGARFAFEYSTHPSSSVFQ